MFDARTETEKLKEIATPFCFMDLEGNVLELPNTQLLLGTQIARLTGGDADALMKELNEGAFEAIQRMPIGVGEKLAMAWIEHGGESGKEPAESPPIQESGEPSNPI